jgi:hypothetical protein
MSWKLMEKNQLDLPEYIWKNWRKFEKHFLSPGLE